MNTFEAIELMRSWGHSLKPEHVPSFNIYFHHMKRIGRVGVIEDNGVSEAIFFFYLTCNYKDLYKKSTWYVAQDDVYGNQVYIDKMICRSWNLSIRRKIQDWIEERFPNVTEGYYHRAPYDRCVKIYRRRIPCMK